MEADDDTRDSLILNAEEAALIPDNCSGDHVIGMPYIVRDAILAVSYPRGAYSLPPVPLQLAVFLHIAAGEEAVRDDAVCGEVTLYGEVALEEYVADHLHHAGLDVIEEDVGATSVEEGGSVLRDRHHRLRGVVRQVADDIACVS